MGEEELLLLLVLLIQMWHTVNLTIYFVLKSWNQGRRLVYLIAVEF